jgi:hypothetical protein
LICNINKQCRSWDESHDISHSTVTTLRAVRSHDRGSIHGGDWEFFSSPPRPNWLWGPPNFLPNGHRGPFTWG